MNHYDVIVLGSYFCDIIFTGIKGFPTLGTEIFSDNLNITTGGVINTVVAFHRLGMAVGWVGALGDDFFSRFVAQSLTEEGISLELVARLERPLRFVTVSLSYPNDRAFVTYTDTSPDEVALLMATLEQVSCRHLHFASLQLDPRLPQLIRHAKARNISVSMDCQHHQYTLDEPMVRDILTELDIFMPNADEARQLTGESTTLAAGRSLARFVPVVVVKDGEHGANAWRDGLHHYAKGISVDAVDTTGAGDVFNAGFLSAYLQGLSLEDCLKRGNVSAGLSTRGLGGAANAPTLADIARFAPSLVD